MSLNDRLSAFMDALPEEVVFGLEAERFIKHDEATNPGELDEWFQVHKVRLIAEQMSLIVRADRRVTAARVRRDGLFPPAPTSPEERTAVAHRLIDDWHAVTVDHVRKRAGDMTGADHKFVAATYTDTGNNAMMLAAFHRAVAKKVGNRKTCDVLNADRYEEMYRSITNR